MSLLLPRQSNPPRQHQRADHQTARYGNQRNIVGKNRTEGDRDAEEQLTLPDHQAIRVRRVTIADQSNIRVE